MANTNEYRITKLEKGPLQRFKNQNLLLKKFGEAGLQVYKAITGKRTTTKLCKDLRMDETLFAQVIEFMQDSGMVELQPVNKNEGAGNENDVGTVTPSEETGWADKDTDTAGTKGQAPEFGETGGNNTAKPGEREPTEVTERPGKPSKQGKQQNKKLSLEELPEQQEDETTQELPPLAEQPHKKQGYQTQSWTDINEEIKPIEFDEGNTSKKSSRDNPDDEDRMNKKTSKPEEEGEENTDELQAAEGNEGDEGSGDADRETGQTDEDIKPLASGETEPADYEGTAGEKGKGRQGSEDKERITYEEEAPKAEPTKLSPVEKIISDRYGDIGLRVYALIDGQRTAEEIMRETGLTEAKLVEILDFMDEQGIIKLDYPKNQPPPPPPPAAPGYGPQMQVRQYGQPPAAGMPPVAQPADKRAPGFTPMIEGENATEDTGPVPSPLEMPIKAPMDLVKSVQTKAKVMLKYGDKGGKLFDAVDGKNDTIDIALKFDMPLYAVTDLLRFMMENGMVIMKQLPRADVRKKYGDDGYSVYKRYGKEGLMLYELIGKELTIRQMADRITKDRAAVIDMFVFIHQVLGIELPLDRDVLTKQLG